MDNDGHEGPWSTVGTFTTGAAIYADANVDGIPDDQETDGSSDLDGNGQPDGTQAGMHCISLPQQAGAICLSVLDGSGAIDALRLVDPATIAETDNRPRDLPNKNVGVTRQE